MNKYRIIFCILGMVFSCKQSKFSSNKPTTDEVTPTTSGVTQPSDNSLSNAETSATTTSAVTSAAVASTTGTTETTTVVDDPAAITHLTICVYVESQPNCITGGADNLTHDLSVAARAPVGDIGNLAISVRAEHHAGYQPIKSLRLCVNADERNCVWTPMVSKHDVSNAVYTPYTRGDGAGDISTIKISLIASPEGESTFSKIQVGIKAEDGGNLNDGWSSIATATNGEQMSNHTQGDGNKKILGVAVGIATQK